jgi:hypothetical protein
MTTIPLLGGLTALVAAATLTGMASVELQLQDRRVAIEAEGLALVVAQDRLANAAPASVASLQRLLDDRIGAFQNSADPITFGFAGSPDGQTVEVRVCHRAKVWALPWLGPVLDRSKAGAVCALARARPVG